MVLHTMADAADAPMASSSSLVVQIGPAALNTGCFSLMPAMLVVMSMTVPWLPGNSYPRALHKFFLGLTGFPFIITMATLPGNVIPSYGDHFDLVLSICLVTVVGFFMLRTVSEP